MNIVELFSNIIDIILILSLGYVYNIVLKFRLITLHLLNIINVNIQILFCLCVEEYCFKKSDSQEFSCIASMKRLK